MSIRFSPARIPLPDEVNTSLHSLFGFLVADNFARLASMDLKCLFLGVAIFILIPEQWCQYISLLAQLVERETVNLEANGSTPLRRVLLPMSFSVIY